MLFEYKFMLKYVLCIRSIGLIKGEHLLQHTPEILVLEHIKMVLIREIKVQILHHPLLQPDGLIDVFLIDHGFVAAEQGRLQDGHLFSVLDHALQRQLHL